MRVSRRRLNPEERRRELLVFGQRFFAEHPTDAFSMDEIAERAGVSRGLLYNYFGGRRGFYVATVQAIADEVSDLTAPAPELPFAAALHGSIGRYLAWVQGNGDVYRVLVQGGLGVDPEVSEILEALRRRTVQRIADSAGLSRTPLVDVAIYGWVCFIENACLDWLSKPEVSRDAMTRILRGALVGAVAACGESLDA